jgi:hypothetical protein
LDLPFAFTRTLDSRITFTRASTATYVDSDWLIKTAATNTPRFDHNPTTGESLGLLIEESRTNKFTYSQNFSNAAWTKQSGMAVAANVSIAAPDGTYTAFTVNRSASDQYLYAVPANSAGTYTISVWARTIAGTSQIAQSCYNGTTFLGNIHTVTTTWQRFASTITYTGATCSWYPASPVAAVDSNVVIWGAQLENGAFATSYIPTSAAAVTRQADLAQIAGTNFTGFYNNTVGSVLAEAKTYNAAATSSGGSSNYLFSIDDISSDNNNFFGAFSNANGTTAFFRVASSDVAYGYRTRPTGGLTKTAIAIQNSNYNSYVDGLQSSNSATLGDPFTPTFVNIGSAYSAGVLEGFWNGHISRLRYWNTRLSNTVLQALTQPTSFQPTIAYGGTESTATVNGKLWRIHSFTTVGTNNFVVNSAGTLGTVEYLVVAGGGSGNHNSGNGGSAGGAGGYRSSVAGEPSGGGATAESRIALSAQTYPVLVAAGGTASALGTIGGNSSFGGIVTLGGGSYSSGGSGSGHVWINTSGFTGTSGQGFPGGGGSGNIADGGTGGGGGAGSAGGTPALNSQNIAGNGGSGVTSSITGTPVARAGGGGGGVLNGGSYGLGGLGGGGTGNTGSGNGGAAQANTGGGGGGSGGNGTMGGEGGSGIVIIRYPLEAL